MTDLCQMSAKALIAEIKKGELSPVDVMKASIDRIEAVDPAVNAMVTRDFDTALNAAKSAEARHHKGEDIGPLAGLPVAIKDLEATAGMRTTYGSIPFRDHVPDNDDLSVAQVKAAGGIVIGKTNTPEFGTGGNTWNDVFGVTGNPYDPTKTCAGSSGGSAVALATGMVPLASGSDFGGSLRTPAGFCGIVGYRPSPGLVPDVDKANALAPFAVLGPMARHVADAALLLNAQMSVDRRDPFSPETLRLMPDPIKPAGLDGIKAAMSVDLGAAPVAEDMRQLFSDRMGILSPAFQSCQWQDPDFTDVHDCFEILRGVSYVAGMKDLVDQHRDKISPLIIDNVERALSYNLADVAMAHQTQSHLAKQWLELFNQVDVVICPAAAVSPFPHSKKFIDEINGQKMPTYMRWLALCYAPTMVMACSLVVPCGLDEYGMPFGIQLLGPPGGDQRLLEIGLAIETELATHDVTKAPLPDFAMLTQSLEK
jgi:Asp-tRNA(Asn)/Glu-tRNA(Gln) amidotransferase A subunit family amidase